MSQEYKDNRKLLGAMIKSDPPKTPIQEVRPVEQPVERKPNTKRVGEADETHVNFWGPTPLVLRLKHYSVQSGKSIKQIIVEALDAHLPKP